MKVPTSRFGTIDVDENQIISMPFGIIGFPHDKRYALLEHKEGSPFLWFQSIDNASLAFVLIDPFLVNPKYEVRINPEDMAALRLSNATKEIQTLVIITLSKDHPVKITANLLGPIVINVSEKIAKQIVLFQSPYSHCHPIPLMENERTFQGPP